MFHEIKTHQFRSPAVSIRHTKSADQIPCPLSLHTLLDCPSLAAPQPFTSAELLPELHEPSLTVWLLLCPHHSASAYSTRGTASGLKEKSNLFVEVTLRPSRVSEWVNTQPRTVQLHWCKWDMKCLCVAAMGLGFPQQFEGKMIPTHLLSWFGIFFTIYNLLEFKNKPVLVAP